MSDLKPYDVNEVVREKIREVLFASLPDDALDAMIQAAYKDFFSDQDIHNRERVSPFKAIVTDQLETLISERVTRWMSEHFEQMYNPDGTMGVKLIGDAAEQLAPLVMKGSVAGMVSDVAVSIKAAIDSPRYV